MRIFVVAPNNGGELKVEEEIAEFTRYHEVVPEIPLIDFVLSSDIAHEVNRAGHCDVFAILGHAGNNGVVLGDGDYLDAEAIGQYARSLDCHTIILNVCNSSAFIRRLAIATQCTVIYTFGDVTDDEAVRFGVLLAKALADTGDTEEAFNRVAPRDRRYRICRAIEKMTSEELRQLGELRQAIYELRASVQAEIAMLRQRNDANERMIQTMERQIEAMRALTPKMTPVSPLAVYVIGAMLTVLALGVFWLLLRGAA